MFRAHKNVKDIKELYDLRRVLGPGKFGPVYEAIHKKADTPCAIKTISKAKLRESHIFEKLMMQELEALDKLEHPHVVRVIDICEDDENVYIVHELMIHGTLT